MNALTLHPDLLFRDDRFAPQSQPALAVRVSDGRKLVVSIVVVLAAVTALTIFSGSHPTFTTTDAEYALATGPVSEQWVERTSALLADNPQLADRLARLIQSSTIDGLQRGMALDALARTGHEVEQSAMIAALSSPALQNDPAYPSLLARLGQIETPTPATLAFVNATATQARRDGADSLAFAAEETQSAYAQRAAQQSTRHGRHWFQLRARGR